MPSSTRPVDSRMQAGFDVRFEWGRTGLDVVAADARAVVIVDVLSFTTCVDVATTQGVQVIPFAGSSDDARAYAGRHGHVAAGQRTMPGAVSLSPPSLLELEPGTTLVLPSPNGSTLAAAAADRGGVTVFAGCLRNAAAVAAAADVAGRPIAVIAAGERWNGGRLRPAVEDLIGAGAVIARLSGTLSPEAKTAADAFESARAELAQRIGDSASGRELAAIGFAEDVSMAAQLDVSNSVPMLRDGGFVALGPGAAAQA